MRRATTKLGVLLSLLVALTGCATEKPSDQHAVPLGDGVLARIGARPLQPRLLRPDGATSALPVTDVLFDFLLAEETRQQLLHRASSAERAVLARALLEDLREEVRRKRTVSQDELHAEWARNWILFDRPRAVRGALIEVKVAELEPEAERQQLASQLRDAARAARNLGELEKALYPFKGQRYSARLVPPVTHEGRVVPLLPQDSHSLTIETSYAEAMSALTAEGQVTPVWTTASGFAFGFALEIVPEQSVPLDEAREQLIIGLLGPAVSQRSTTIVGRAKPQVHYAKKDLAALLQLVWQRR